MKILKSLLFLLAIQISAQQVEDKIDIRINQLGYTLGKTKLISLNASSNVFPVNYKIKDNKGEIIKSGTILKGNLWKDANEYVGQIDFSEVNKEGKYVVSVNNQQKEFSIGSSVYTEAVDDVFKYYYYNRSGIEIEPEFAGKWSRPLAMMDDKIKVHVSAATKERPEGTIINGSKGWYDAGDYNKYVVNSGISTYTLLSAYENFPEYFKNKKFNIPESNNDLPDILDEVIWNLDWMLLMQDPNDGGVYHKLTGLNFSGVVMPKAYNLDRYVVKKSTGAALNFAAVTAMAARIFSEFKKEKPNYSKRLLEASKKAYEWAKKNPEAYYLNPKGVKTGQYEDDNVLGEFQWAAVELFITTKKNIYKKDINIKSISNEVPWWKDASALALYSITNFKNQLKKDVNVSLAEKKLLAKAKELKKSVEKSPMRIAMTTPDYVWGSNGVAGNQLMYLMKAYEISKKASFLDAVFVGMDYLVGRNGLGVSFITGIGTNAAKNPHHRISEADDIKEAVPGMVVGGPQPGQQDKCKYPSTYAAKSYSDTWCSYASNEVTINWNAPMVYVMSALNFTETK
ncbi:glycoside hydrolase family 9 protein [Tenacibaculum sp. M341]|uniref:glycoside hydrolase family 9 protein n=1 Tax=Tenacibaculum sp. M341 TaxID=2530339 RepID=UPI001047F19D|nr:glycoside hydrolase family 9 protein [Tenacibaculum sp. M341]TCI85155.1 cellulase [Tenacibaculum sp. M341]